MRCYVDSGIYGIDNFSFQIDKLSVDNILDGVESRLPDQVRANSYVCFANGLVLNHENFLKYAENDDIFLRLNGRLRGGKGGFGSMLRAQGGKMTRRKKGKKDDAENDSFRTLDGRRVKSMRQAKELAKYLETASEIHEKKVAEKKEKLKQVIELMSKTDKSKFNDTEFLEQSEELINDIKRAVSNAPTSIAVISEPATTNDEKKPSSPKHKTSKFFDEFSDDDSE